MKVRILLVTALLSIGALPAAAQSVKLSFHGGKVDLVAENATVRAILTEWARVGSTRIVNAERLVGPPVTVEFKDAYEQRVLEALLRNVSRLHRRAAADCRRVEHVGVRSHRHPADEHGAGGVTGHSRRFAAAGTTANPAAPDADRRRSRRQPRRHRPDRGQWPRTRRGRKRLPTCAAVSVRFSKPSPTATMPNRRRRPPRRPTPSASPPERRGRA